MTDLIEHTAVGGAGILTESNSLHSCSVTKETWSSNGLSVEKLDLSIEGKKLITNASFNIASKDRIVLLGRNGCGKSTLFNWITMHKSTPLSIYNVSQELPESKMSITKIVLSAHIERGKLWEIQANLESKEELSSDEVSLFKKIGEELSAMKADADPPRVKKILHGLGFSPEQMECPLNTFSGGWRARVGLAMGLFIEPDLLLLDEPTNHLDLEGVIWLCSYLEKWKKAFIVISHNIGFIRAVGNKQWLIENGCLYIYNCTYDKYLKQRALDMKKIEKSWELLEKEVQAIKGKGTPASKKAAEELIKKRTAEGVVRPVKPYNPKFSFGETISTIKHSLLSPENTKLGYDGKIVLSIESFALYNGTHVALVGTNGSGKSTFIKFLAGELDPICGEISRRHGLKILKFDQHFYHSLPDESTPLDYILSNGGKAELVREMLGKSGLGGEAHTRPIKTLSGGQKARVYFTYIAIQQPDIMLLDEPTNHLDIETIDALCIGLKEFHGASIIVSHDIDFLEKVSTEVWKTEKGVLSQISDDISGLETYVETLLESIEDSD
jgi:ATP-binding cassette subfamily F protein 1